MPIMIGAPGRLTALPYTTPTQDATLTRAGGTHALLSGGAVLDAFGWARRYTLTWERLTADHAGLIENLALGTYATPPLLLVDHYRRNHLPGNVAATGSLTGTWFEWAAPGGADTSIDAGAATLGRSTRRAVPWRVPNGAASGRVLAAPCAQDSRYSAGPDTTLANPALTAPYITGWTHRFTAYATPAAAVTPLVRAVIRYHNLAGALLGSTPGAAAALPAPGTWQRYETTATLSPPAGTVWVTTAMETQTANSSGAAWIIHSSDWMLEAAPTLPGVAPTWVPGTGVPRVAPDPQAWAYQRPYRPDVTLTLVEIGAR